MMKFAKPFIMLGTTPNSVTFRAQDGAKANFQDMMALVQKKSPLSSCEGGGHPQAGTFRFAEAKNEEVMKIVEDYLQSL